MGEAVGSKVGVLLKYVGTSVGVTVGALEGLNEGSGVGTLSRYDGLGVQRIVGANEGAAEGSGVGLDPS